MGSPMTTFTAPVACSSGVATGSRACCSMLKVCCAAATAAAGNGAPAAAPGTWPNMPGRLTAGGGSGAECCKAASAGGTGAAAAAMAASSTALKRERRFWAPLWRRKCFCAWLATWVGVRLGT
jgi:hypothetical protein